MGKLVVGVARFLLVCALVLPSTLLVSTEAFAYGETLAVSPLWGPLGRTVTLIGTGWIDHARLGWDVPIWIGFANEVARGKPDANGEFSVRVTIPLNPPPQEIINGKLRIGAIIGNGGAADAFYTISNTPLPGCVNAHFIGVHGTLEGPDALNLVPFVSKVIDETWKNFYGLAKERGEDNVKGCALDYAGSLENLLAGAVDPGVEELDEYIRDEILKVCPTQSIVLAGYSLGAWIIDDWLRRNKDVWPNIVAVELYGDPLWHRAGNAYLGGPIVSYDGVARLLGLHLGVLRDRPDPYMDNQQGPVGLSDRWQSRCLHGDPICGEGYRDTRPQRTDTVLRCMPDADCKHKKYAFKPAELGSLVTLGTRCTDLPKQSLGSNGQTGVGLTTRGAGFLAMKAFPDVLKPGDTPHPKIMLVETFREGEEPLVFFRLFFTDPGNTATGFGFRGAKGSLWAEENHPFSSPSYGRVSPGRIEYPFNHLCGTSSAYESDVEAWLYDRAGQRSQSITVHLACSAPSEVVTPFPAVSGIAR